MVVIKKDLQRQLANAYYLAHEKGLVYGVYHSLEDTKIKLKRRRHKTDHVLFRVEKWTYSHFISVSPSQDLELQIKNLSLVLAEQAINEIWRKLKGSPKSNPSQETTLF